MNDPRSPQNFGPPQQGSPSTWAQDAIDYPAYADDMPYAGYGAGAPWAPGSYQPNPTRQLPPQPWQQGETAADQPGDGSPEGPRPPRWLWFAAGAAVLLVLSLVIALVIANESAKRQAAIAPLPPMSPTTTVPPTTHTTPPTTTHRPPRITTTVPSTTVPPATPTTPAVLQTVVYSVTGEGRAISVMYMDTGDLIQTEFNVTLPWSKQVSLTSSPTRPASVTVVNIGHNVTCSVAVGGVQMRQRTGQGLTICDAPV